jgi:hypothetical protein
MVPISTMISRGVEMVDRTLVLQHLKPAEEHVAQGLEHIRRQREIIVELERDGHETKQARDLLATFLQAQAMHEQDLARLRGELGE